MHKTTVVYDDIIFRLQINGGISKVFKNIIKYYPKFGYTNLFLLVSGKSTFSEIGISHSISEFKIPAVIQQFCPLFSKLPANCIYHSTYLRYTYQKNIIKIITIHDCGYEYGIMQSGIKKWVHLFFKKLAIRKCNAIICVSNNTRNDLLKFYPELIKNKPVKVIYNGIDEIYFKQRNLENVSNDKKYILYVGNRNSYKNFKSVINAFRYLNDYCLVIVGVGVLSGEHKIMLNTILQNNYKYLQDIDEQKLTTIYSKAYCLVYPSSYEGFGLPIIEAMACGCPVIACNNSSIPEIANNAAILIDKPEAYIIAEAIKSLEKGDLRNELINKGKIHAQSFSWENTTIKTLEFYKHLKDKF